VVKKNGTYMWSFMTQIFRNVCPGHGRNHKLWYCGSIERYIYYICRCCWNINGMYWFPLWYLQTLS